MKLSIRAIHIAKKENVKMLWYYLEGIMDPEKWLEKNKGSKDAEARYEKRKELKDMWKATVPSNPLDGSGPLVKSGYGKDAPFVLVKIEADGSIGWMIPAKSHDSKSVTLLNGQTVEVVNDKLKTTKEADKTWAEVAEEVKGERGKKKQPKAEEGSEG